MVGVPGFEPGTSSSRTMRATRLRYTPPQIPRRCLPLSPPNGRLLYTIAYQAAMVEQTSATGQYRHRSPGLG